jgi:hypothetical protein
VLLLYLYLMEVLQKHEWVEAQQKTRSDVLECQESRRAAFD